MAFFEHLPNTLLASLSVADFNLFRSHLRSFELVNGDVLVEAGAPLLLVYFPHSGIISSVVSLAGGETTEVAMIGRDGAFGASAALNGNISPTAGIVRFPGTGLVLDVVRFCTALAQSRSLRAAIMRHQWLRLLQAEQSVACSASHTTKARLGRRLLLARDLSGSDTLPLTQEILGGMLGVRRNSVALAANALQKAGIISYSRGHITITNLDGLMKCACECYETIKTQNETLNRIDERPWAA